MFNYSDYEHKFKKNGDQSYENKNLDQLSAALRYVKKIKNLQNLTTLPHQTN